MKKIILVFYSVLFALACYSAPSAAFTRAWRNGAMAKIAVKVLDDQGNPVSNAAIRAFFEMALKGGGEVVNATTDKNGCAMLTGKTSSSIFFKVSKDGYYATNEELCFVAMGQEYEVNRGKWQPWGLQKIPSLRRCIF